MFKFEGVIIPIHQYLRVRLPSAIEESERDMLKATSFSYVRYHRP